MENSYGVGVRNRYDIFFDDEADPFEIIKKPAAVVKDHEEKENKSSKGKSATSDKKKAATKIESAVKSAEKSTAPSEYYCFHHVVV